MTDAASLLAWGRSIVAAKRGGVGGEGIGASTSSPGVGGSRKPGHPSAVRVGGGGSSAEDDVVLHDHRQTLHARAAVASLHRPSSSFGNDNTDGIAAPTEAREKHWQWLDRFDHAAASTPVSSANSHRGGASLNASGAHVTSNPQRATAVTSAGPARRRSLTVAGSSASTSQSHETLSSHSDLMQKHDEEILRRRVEAEKKHVAELLTMRDRNFEEFSNREAELLAELDALPRILEEAENRRVARLSSSSEYVHERDLTAMEEILWSLESRIHEVATEEERFGTTVAQCAECAQCSESMAAEIRDLVPFELCRALRRLGPTLLELRAFTQNAPRIGGTERAHVASSIDCDSIPGLSTRVPEEKELREHFQRVAELLGQPNSSETNGETALIDAIPPDHLFSTISEVVVNVVGPFLCEVQRIAKSLRHARAEQLAAVSEALTEADAQLNLQKVTMDEAHAAINDMVAQLDAIHDDTSSVDARIASIEQSIGETKQRDHDGVERAAALSARKLELENEMRALKEQIAASKREFGQLQLTERKHNKVSEAHNQRCDALREEARSGVRGQLEALEGSVSQLLRESRTISSVNEQLDFEAQKLSEKVDASKQRLRVVQEKVVVVQRQRDAHESEREQCERERNDIRRDADEADRLFQSLEVSTAHLRQDAAACSDDIFAARQQLHAIREDSDAASERVQDALEELELVRAVLLHQEASAGGSGGSFGTAASQRMVDEDHTLLHMRSPIARKQGPDLVRVSEEPEPRPTTTTTTSADPARSRSKQWRSTSRSSEPSPSAHTSAIHPPDELETVAPPPAWSRMMMDDNPPAVNAAPLFVAPHARHYQRERNALLATHEKSRQALVDYLESSDYNDPDEEEGETVSSDVEELSDGPYAQQGDSVVVDQRPRHAGRVAPHHQAGVVHQRGVGPATSKWDAAPPHIVYNDPTHPMRNYRRGTETGGADEGRSSSVFSSAPPSEAASEYEPPFAARRTHDPSVGHNTSRRPHNDRTTRGDEDWAPPLKDIDAHHSRRHVRHGADAPAQPLAQRVVPPQVASNSSDVGRRHHVDPASVHDRQPTHPNTTSTTTTGASSKLQDRLMLVKAKLHRAVADHSTAHAKKPFR